jgi:hypothetical protein
VFNHPAPAGIWKERQFSFASAEMQMLNFFQLCHFCRVMSNHNTETVNGGDLVRKSSLYREFQAEREEILKHKWIESEKAGYDIGFERALTDWIIKHRARWRQSRQGERSVN